MQPLITTCVCLHPLIEVLCCVAVQVWKIRTGACVKKFQSAHTAAVTSTRCDDAM
jgi:hypothetical protein